MTKITQNDHRVQVNKILSEHDASFFLTNLQSALLVTIMLVTFGRCTGKSPTLLSCDRCRSVFCNL